VFSHSIHDSRISVLMVHCISEHGLHSIHVVGVVHEWRSHAVGVQVC
jgi:hypothetical protein